MNSNHLPFEDCQDTSTPKRRRLVTGRILRSKNHVHSSRSKDFTSNCSPITCQSLLPSQRSESPHLPCNQVEFLCDSSNSSSSQLPAAPADKTCSFAVGVENWDSLVVSTDAIEELCNQQVCETDSLVEFEEISEDMFTSKLELSNCHTDVGLKFEKSFKENIEHGFNKINQSICELSEDPKQHDGNSLFETKDSFLLDINDSEMVDETRPKCNKETNIEEEQFYGLPMITKNLFKSLRHIEKFYDWQEECLSLPAIKRRQNLIYALPTSGGKTLVAEVLMLREVLNRKKNALFILPFVAIVQEKIWALSPFAVQLDFLVEEYAAGKGHIPPKKRRNKNSIYIATMEKGLALVRSLIELNRLDEISLIVVDELHLIGEKSRGGTLETLLTTVLFANPSIQIVGMSATIGNLSELGAFLRAAVFSRDFRPVQLAEFAKRGDQLLRIRWGRAGAAPALQPAARLTPHYSESAKRLDPDGLAALVWAGDDPSSCLVFCPTKNNCENVASLLCQLQPSSLRMRRAAERAELERALRADGAAPDLRRCVARGVAYHHAGLGPDERPAIEHAFRAGVLDVVCCTSTLAAGVNLPAARVVLRAPYVGRDFITLAAYRQMVGRAGRAGLADAGCSTVVCSERDWARLCGVLGGGVAAARSQLDAEGVAALLLSGVALRLADTRPALRRLAARSLRAVPPEDPHLDQAPVDIDAECDDALAALLRAGALEALPDADAGSTLATHGPTAIQDNTRLTVSKLAMAAIKGCMGLGAAARLLRELAAAARALVLLGGLHLLYLVARDTALRLDYAHYYSLYCSLDDEGMQTARVLGINEENAIRMITGKPTAVPEDVLRRFYVALMLRDLCRQVPLPAVADKYGVGRGAVQGALTAASAFAASAARVVSAAEGAEGAPWPMAALLAELAPRLQHCAAPHLADLLALPHVRKSRAMQLARAGFARVEALARAAPARLAGAVPHLSLRAAEHLVSAARSRAMQLARAGFAQVEALARAAPARLAGAVPHLSLRAAEHLVSAARMMLIEKVENLRAEAEDVLDELKV